MQVKVIVFDLYNTLIETGHSQNFFKDIYKRSEDGFGLTFGAYHELLLTRNLEALFKILPKEFSQLCENYKAELDQQMATVSLYPETKAVLEELSRHYELYLISNAASPYKTNFFALGLEVYFKAYIFSCDVACLKPDPAIFKIVEERSGCRGDEILMVGDSKIADIRGAKRRKWQSLRVDRKKRNLSKGEISHLRALFNRLS